MSTFIFTKNRARWVVAILLTAAIMITAWAQTLNSVDGPNWDNEHKSPLELPFGEAWICETQLLPHWGIHADGYIFLPIFDTDGNFYKGAFLALERVELLPPYIDYHPYYAIDERRSGNFFAWQSHLWIYTMFMNGGGAPFESEHTADDRLLIGDAYEKHSYKKVSGLTIYGDPREPEGTAIKKVQKVKTGLFKANVVSDKMEILLPVGENLAKFVVYDAIGNVVATGTSDTWNLTNSSGRFVANGSYLVVVETRDKNGRNVRYSGKIGVKR